MALQDGGSLKQDVDRKLQRSVLLALRSRSMAASVFPTSRTIVAASSSMSCAMEALHSSSRRHEPRLPRPSSVTRLHLAAGIGCNWTLEGVPGSVQARHGEREGAGAHAARR